MAACRSASVPKSARRRGIISIGAHPCRLGLPPPRKTGGPQGQGTRFPAALTRARTTPESLNHKRGDPARGTWRMVRGDFGTAHRGRPRPPGRRTAGRGPSSLRPCARRNRAVAPRPEARQVGARSSQVCLHGSVPSLGHGPVPARTRAVGGHSKAYVTSKAWPGPGALREGTGLCRPRMMTPASLP